ncbi:hypothetical protein B0I35DRAFT_420085 [Stachybotrys elegans]|uniref:Uncharacterized protein n=1 Tax=Stachybotrys elegans TaxID=80388 RepID=A0A8K0T5W7_9HYPO|nr:hypothetical protein B0I35DRAFT_420085 [Stachybotrys elegans]
MGAVLGSSQPGREMDQKTSTLPKKLDDFQGYSSDVDSGSASSKTTRELHGPDYPSDHSCIWRSRCINLASEIQLLKSKLHSQNHVPLVEERVNMEVGRAQNEHNCQDYGLEGLTIVMHMKGKDDVVINTDLTQEGSTWTRDGSSCDHA